MMGKLIPLNNDQQKEQIFVVTGCGWYLNEVEGMHVSCPSHRVPKRYMASSPLRKGNSNQVIHLLKLIIKDTVR